MAQQPGQRGHEPAAAAARHQLARARRARTSRGRGWRAGRAGAPCQPGASFRLRPAVHGLRQARSVKIRSQSRSRRGIRKCVRTYSLPARPEPLAQLGVAEDLDARLGGLLGRVDQVAGLAVLDLERDAAHVAGDRGPRLPERLGDRQAESLADRLLQHHVGLRLERVDLDRADVVEVVEDLDVLVARRRARASCWKKSQPSGSSVAIEPTSASCTSGDLLLDLAVGSRSRPAGPSRGRSGRPGRSAAGRRRRRTGRRRRRRPRARAPCSWATAGRSPAAGSRPCRRRPRARSHGRWNTLQS